MNALYQQRLEIMNQFNFDRVRMTMKALDWGWRGEAAPPSISDIESQADYIMQTAISSYTEGDPFRSVSSGGFTALILRYDAGPKLSLMFCAAQRSGN
jgi:hypothetical protein